MGESPPMVRFWRALAMRQVQSPVRFVVAMILLCTVGAALAVRLRLRPELTELLPDDQPSVVELRRVMARIKGMSNVFIVLEGESRSVRAMADAVVPALHTLGAPWVGTVQSGMQDARAFLMPRVGLFADAPALEQLRDELRAREQHGFAQAVGADFDDPPPPLTPDHLQALLGPQARLAHQYPDGYFQTTDGHALVVVVRSAILPDDLPQAREALTRIRHTVDDVARRAVGLGVRIGYAGDLVTGTTEYANIRTDLMGVGITGVTLVLAVILLFFLRVRALILLGITIAAGCTLTFGLTGLCLGTLNIATGFLFSIVAGNGINCGIILQARYLEERARKLDPATSLGRAVEATWKPTLGATVAAMAAYGALATTSFRAFRDFAFIGASGMMLCWLATYALLPALLILSERLWPLDKSGRTEPRLASLRASVSRFERPFVWAVEKAPLVVVVVGLALAAVSVHQAVRYAQQDPLEYDLRHMETDRSETGELYRLSALAARIVGASAEGAMAVVADRIDQVPDLVRALRARRDAAPAGQKPFEEVHSVFDFVPPDQSAKIALLNDLRRRVLRAYDVGALSEQEWTAIAPFLPPPGLQPLTLAQLPEPLLRPFTERDGSVGRLIYIEPTAGERDSNVHYLLRWAAAFRQTRLPSGEIIHGSGRAVVYADLVGAVLDNGPRALLAALALTLASVMVTFRRARDVVPVMGALIVGLCWLGGAMAIFKVRLHFINFVALPITLGIGVDYAVNIVGRSAESGGGRVGIARALRETGGAVVLCSLTTTFGYLALLGSRNQGVRSLGLLAVLGEVTCLLAALLVLPAALTLWASRKDAKADRANVAIAP